MLQYHEVAAVPHGFRSSFRDWAAEETDHPREVIEAALAHVVQNKVEAAYARSDLFGRRRLLMDDWAEYLVGRVPGGQRPVNRARRPMRPSLGIGGQLETDRVRVDQGNDVLYPKRDNDSGVLPDAG